MLESLHFSRRLDVSPQQLVDAADRWHHKLHRASWPSRSLHATKRFWLSTESVARSTEFVEQYEVRGVLWTCGRPIPVILDFSQYSTTQSEIGITPCAMSWPVGTECYGHRVKSVLLLLELEVCTYAYLVNVSEKTTRADAPFRPSLAH